MRRRDWSGIGPGKSFALILFFCASVARADDYLSLVTEYSPPYSMTVQGEEAGIATNIVRAILGQAQIGYHIREYPWSRAYHEALLHSNTCVYLTTMTERRKPLFRWVGPIVRDSWVAFAIETNTVRIGSLDDLNAYRLGTSLGSARSAFLSDNNLAPHEVLTDELNINMLENGRIDFWVASQRRGEYLIRSHRVDNIRPVFSLSRVEYYLACNKNTPSAVIDRLNDAIQALGEGRREDALNADMLTLLR